MDNSKIFSKIHGAYKDNFRKLQVFGIFGMENHTSSEKLVRVLITFVIVVYPMVSLTFGFIVRQAETADFRKLLISQIFSSDVKKH
jgi:hypothetical protein